MAKINTIISPQGYEIIRDRIALILADELANQSAMTYDEDFDATVYTERFTPVSYSECPVIIVSLSKGTFDNYTQINHHGSYIFDIDAYAALPSNDNNDGDFRSTVSIHKLLGVCKSILLNPIYYILDFEPGFIEHRSVTEINIATPNRTPESENMAMGRISVLVKCRENLNLIDNSVLLCQSNTNVRIGLTDKGYAYSRIGCLSGDFSNDFNDDF
jgi:hypothetical protein